MERVAVEVDGVDLGVRDVDLVGVGALVESGVDLQAAAGLRRPIRLMIVSSETRGLPRQFIVMKLEQAVLDLVPLRGAGREVADLDLQAGLVGELLQLDLPQPHAVAVGAAAVGGDRQRAWRSGSARLAEVLPPARIELTANWAVS